MSSFDSAVNSIIETEGREFTNDPLDPGGATKFGITWRAFHAWRPNATFQEFVDMQEPTAHEFYREVHWDPMNLDKINDERVAYILFDQGINRGLMTVVKEVQLMLNNKFGKFLLVDGGLGDKTAEAINSIRTDEFIVEFVGQTEIDYVNIVIKTPSQIKWLRGWINRALGLLRLLLGKR